MGQLFYGSSRESIRLPDLSLAYLQAVTVAKLRRSEAFFVSWRSPHDTSGPRSHLWLHPAIPLRFVISTGGIRLESAIVEQLMRTAATSASGIDLDTIPSHPAHDPAYLRAEARGS